MNVAARNRRNRQKGSQFESDAIDWFRSLGLKAEGLRKAGRNDEGDVAVEDVDLTYVVECKNEKRIDPAGFVKQAMVEADNYAKRRGIPRDRVMAVALVKRRNHPIHRSYVFTEAGEFWAP